MAIKPVVTRLFQSSICLSLFLSPRLSRSPSLCSSRLISHRILSGYFFFLLLVSPSLSLPHTFLSPKHSTSPRWRMSPSHTSVFQLVLHCSGENTDTNVNIWTAAQDGRGAATWFPCVSLPVRLWWVNQRSPRAKKQSKMASTATGNDRQRAMVPRLWEAHTVFSVCYAANGPGRGAKMAACPRRVCLINKGPYILLEQSFWMTTDYWSLVCKLFIT